MKNSTKNLLQRFLKNDATTLLLRLALLYILWFLCRIVFYLQNAGLVGPLEWNEIPGLLRGAGMFDTASILYVNALFILLSLLPFRFRERKGYQRMLLWLYSTVPRNKTVPANTVLALHRYQRARADRQLRRRHLFPLRPQTVHLGRTLLPA